MGRINLQIDVYPPYYPVSVHFIHNNGCCDKDYFVLTTNKMSNGETNYSCQCACGGWCTDGHNKAQDAINEYFEMCDRKEREDN